MSAPPTPDLPIDTETPPLGLGLGCVMFGGFMLMAAYAGIMRIGRAPVTGTILTVVAVALLATTWFAFRKKYAAWLVVVIALTLILASLLVSAAVGGTILPLIWAPLFGMPLALFLQPGVRDVVRRQSSQ